MATLKFYTNPMSRGRIVRWMLEEVGAPYETQIISYGEEMKGTAYLGINPMGKVPAIVHDGKTVTECAAICTYLSLAFPETGLGPTKEEMADFYRWIFFAAGPLEQAVVNRSMGWEPEGDKKATAGYGNFDLARSVLIGAVTGRDYICGARFTAADVYVGSHVGWGLQFGTIPADPALEAYSARVYAREAYLRATELDDALMPDQPG